MASINLDLDYFGHPKTDRLVYLLGRGTDSIPIRLWCFVGKYHCESGKLIGYSPEEIEAKVGWEGRPGDCVAALLETGFLEILPEGYQVHDWLEHAGHIHAYKLRSKRAALARWGGNAEALSGVPEGDYATSNATSNACALHSNAKSIEKVLNQKPLKKKMRKEFAPPTLEEVAAYCQEKSYGFDPQEFIGHYESNGWKVGPNAMKSWHGACLTWQRRFLAGGFKNQHSANGQTSPHMSMGDWQRELRERAARSGAQP